MQDLPIIQKTYDLIKWYVPILNRLPIKHKLGLNLAEVGRGILTVPQRIDLFNRLNKSYRKRSEALRLQTEA